MSQKDAKARNQGVEQLRQEHEVLAELHVERSSLVQTAKEIQTRLEGMRAQATIDLAQVSPDALVKLATQRAKTDFETKALEDSLQEIMRRQRELQEKIDAQDCKVQAAEIVLENAELWRKITEMLSEFESLLPRVKGMVDASRDLKRPKNHALWIVGRLAAVRDAIEKTLEVAADTTLDI